MKQAGVIVFSYYPEDPRVRRETEALAEAGYSIDVICLKKSSQKYNETDGRINIMRLPLKRRRGGKIMYILQYFIFIAMSALLIGIRRFEKKYSVVHIHNMPDILVFSGSIPKLFGAKIIMDMHDPMPELYMTKYGLGEGHYIIKAIKVMERMSLSFADTVITPNIAFKNIFCERNNLHNKINIVMNTPQENIFNSNNISGQRKNKGTVLMFHGTIVERHGLDTAIKAVHILRDRIKDIQFNIFGEGEYVENILNMAQELNVADRVNYYGHVSLDRIAEEIGSIDVGLIPNKRTPFTEVNLPTRIFEYLSMGKNVIVPSTRGIRDYFDDDEIYYFEPGNPDSLAETIKAYCENISRREEILKNGMEVYRKYLWSKEKLKYQRIVSSLERGDQVA